MSWNHNNRLQNRLNQGSAEVRGKELQQEARTAAGMSRHRAALRGPSLRARLGALVGRLRR